MKIDGQAALALPMTQEFRLASASQAGKGSCCPKASDFNGTHNLSHEMTPLFFLSFFSFVFSTLWEFLPWEIRAARKASCNRVAHSTLTH